MRRTPSPDGRTAPVAAPYDVRLLLTDAERTEAGALVEDRLRWLGLRGLPLPVRSGGPELDRQTRRAPGEAAGLFEDDVLLACLILDPEPDLAPWGRAGSGPSLFLSRVHTLPAYPVDVLCLITLWASDHAARLGLPCVRAEAPVRRDLGSDPIRPVLDRLQDMGWAIRSTGKGTVDERVARLEIAAESRPGLTALINCGVPLPSRPVLYSSGRCNW
ncbi:hypothetical protein J7I94_16085 [Streptomyces sp. ISL-12]|uniref:hypothetical protein n=1 Tax=Streptomyces sp. ISL-12 TaxID=2819177 RepID=UPI001BE583FC|nr:hypothetical protein [Streptomyces sp. ISL-12]MBT2412070.1 hypothetical protein [Streptomyces sp. ISL-12]